MYRKLVMFGLVVCWLLLFLGMQACIPATPSATVEGEMPMVPESGQKEKSDMTEKVTAVAILRNTAGLSILDAKEPITAENVEKYQVETEVIEEASRKLEQLGVKVLQEGSHTLTISADKAVFESVFNTTLEIRSTEIMGTKTTGAEVSHYEATKPIRVPEDLFSLIAAVDLETPVEYFP